MLAFDAPALHGELQAKLTPEAVVTVLPQEEAQKRSGGVFSLFGDAKWNNKWSLAQIRGQCALYSAGAGTPKPLFLKADPNRSVDCILREGYVEAGGDKLTFSAGKRTLDFSQALLTSPSNPATVGLTLPSPLGPQEGIWNLRSKYIFSDTTSILVGTALTQISGETQGQPFGRLQWNADAVDLSTVVADRFLGGSAFWQSTSNWMLYSELNAHIAAKRAYDFSNIQSDALVGSSFSPSFVPWTLTLEYFRNSRGLEGGASATRLASPSMPARGP